jgi:hypothetical protein
VKCFVGDFPNFVSCIEVDDKVGPGFVSLGLFHPFAVSTLETLCIQHNFLSHIDHLFISVCTVGVNGKALAILHLPHYFFKVFAGGRVPCSFHAVTVFSYLRGGGVSIFGPVAIKHLEEGCILGGVNVGFNVFNDIGSNCQKELDDESAINVIDVLAVCISSFPVFFSVSNSVARKLPVRLGCNPTVARVGQMKGGST